jgi:HIV Tat-specific factor 1
VDEAVLQQQVYVGGDEEVVPIPTGADGAPAVPKGQGRKKRKGPPKAPPKTTAVYVSGLPLDVTKEELIPFMAKCGIIKKDPDSGEYKVRLYEDELGRLKGDALVIYLKRASVDLALTILDESEFRPGSGPVVRVTEVFIF